MRQIEYKACRAIENKTNFRLDNTKIEYDLAHQRSYIYLHNNLIGIYHHLLNAIEIRDCGYYTKTTKSRINSLLLYFNCKASVYQKNFNWYINRQVLKKTFSFKSKNYFIVHK